MICIYCMFSHFMKNKYEGICTFHDKVVTRISGCKDFIEIKF